MVSAANPLAVEAGLEVLRAGGNALDAAVAVQMVLGFAEAPETGIGGGGFLLYRDGASGQLHFYDGRETAPAATSADRFTLLGRPAPLWLAVPSGRSVGVPGLVAMLALAHDEHGRMDWADLLAPAIELAEDGIDMPPRLQRQVAGDRSLGLFGDTRRHFRRPLRRSGPPPQLHNPELAQSLRLIAEQGPEALYGGPLGDALVERARSRWPWRSDLTAEDLAGYSARVREPVCGRYRQWTLCGPPPPSSGGVAVLQILGVLEHFPLPDLAPDDPLTLHLIAEASRLAFADRYHYLGDPDFVSVPVAELIDPDYLAQRAQLIDPRRAKAQPLPGEPGRRPEMPEAPPKDEEETEGTSHFTIVDAQGNLVALTSSIEAPFGSRMMAAGFLLNNQLTDFTFTPTHLGRPHPNAPAPGKRPRSSMSPFMVFDEQGEARLVIGSRGGSGIIGYVVKALIGTLDWEMDVQDAIALPNFLERGNGVELERGSALEVHAPALRALGHRVRITGLPSGLHGIEWIDGTWRGGADPRLDGRALGD